jgi:drug/metabolite transporter (DMT)-like permease
MMNWVVLAVFCSMLGAVGQMFFKLGADRLVIGWELLQNWQLGVGLLCYGVATIGFILVLKNMRLSLAYPIIALSYIWVALLSYYALKEPMTLKVWLGSAIIVFGVVLVQLK